MSNATNDNPLTTSESTAFAKHESTITKGLATFVDVGNALAAIRDGKFYRETHKTFEAYCVERWEFGKAYAHRQIGAACIIESLSPMGDILPTSERQARPLTTIDVDKVGDVWKDVLDKADVGGDGKPVITAKLVQGVVDLWKADDEPYREEPEEPAFDYDFEREWIFDTIRGRIGRWPADHRSALSQVLVQLSKEALLVATDDAD